MADQTHDASPADRLLDFLDSRRRWIFGLLALLLVVGYNGQWRISPDSALYVELGRNLAEGAGFSYHGQPHTWVEPGLPYSIGASFRLFGADNFHPLMLVMLLCAGASLVLTYALFTRYAGRRVGVLMVTLLGVSETFYRYAFHLFTDMPFLLGVLAFLLAYEWIVRGEKRWLAWPVVGAAVLFMTAVRPAVITFVGAVGLSVAWHVIRGPMRVRHAVLGAVVLAAFFGFRLLDPRRGQAGGGEVHRETMLKSLLSDRLGLAARRMVTEWVPKMLEETTTEALFGTRLGPGVSSVVAVAAIASGILLARRRMLWGVWVAATVAQMAFWRPLERYFLPILPLLLFGMWDLTTRITHPAHTLGQSGTPRRPGSLEQEAQGSGAARVRSAPAWRRWSPVVLVALLVVPNLVYVAKFIVDQRRRPFLARYEKGEKLELIELAKRIGADVPDGAHVIADGARELSYFSRRDVVDPLTARRVPPTDAEYAKLRNELAARGNQVYVVAPGEKTADMVARLGGIVGDPVTASGKWSVRRVRFTPTDSAGQPGTRAALPSGRESPGGSSATSRTAR